jgi:hypothetical protein
VLSRVAWPNMVSAGVIALIAAVFLGPFGDLDYSWQILAGKQIVDNGRLMIVDESSYTIAGQTLPDFEWLWDVALYCIWQCSGYSGLKLLKLTCAFGPLLIVGRQLRQRGIGWAGILLAQLVAVLVLAPNWNLRPLCCTTVGLLLVSGYLHDHCVGRRQLTWRLPVVMFLWANCHPGVIAGQALLIGAVAWEWLNRVVRLNIPLDRAALRRLTWFGGLSLLATFISPAPIERLLYPFRTRLDDPIWRVFVEMQPAYQFITRPPFTMILAYVLFALVAVALAMRIRHCRLWEIALLVCTCGMANMAVRALPDWLLLTLAIGVPHLKELCSDESFRVFRVFSGQTSCLRPALDKWRELAHSPAWTWQWTWPAAAVATLIGLVSIPPISQQLMAVNLRDNPVAAVEWMQANNIHGRIFGPPDYGSYLGWHMGNQAKCYVDTRGFYFPPQLIADAQLLPALTDDWQSRLDRVLAAGTDYFLLESTGPRAGLWQAIEPHVEPLYRDGQSVLLAARQIREGQKRYVKANSGASEASTRNDADKPNRSGRHE